VSNVAAPYTVESHFEKSAKSVRATYAAILRAARALGEVREDPKKTSIHLLRDSAFAGIATQKEALILTLKADRLVKSPRVRKSERTSKNRWHMELKLASPDDVDAELRRWLKAAFELA